MWGLGKKQKNTEEKIYLCEGLSLAAPVSMPKLNKSLEVLTRGAIEVLIVFGAVGGFMSSINMDYRMPFILLSYILMAAYFSNLFRTQKIWLRDIGYVAYLAVFFVFVAAMHRHINSGFYALVNELMNKISSYYGVSDIRVFQEMVSERTVTVPVAALFIGNVVIVILNIFLSYFMSETVAVIICLPVFVVPLFFRQEPGIIYIVCMAAGLAGVFALKGNRHYRIPKHREQFLVKQKDKQQEITYGRSGKSAAEMTLCFFLVSVITVFSVSVFYPRSDYSYGRRTSSLKSQIERPLGNVLLYGLSALRNIPNTGGMAGGKLGGVSSVLNDNKTDLEVTFVPRSTDRIYLRAFVGDIYARDHWEKDEDGLLPNTVETAETVRMDVKNVDASRQYLYLPPNMVLGEEELVNYREENGIKRGDTGIYQYAPDGWPTEKPDKESYLQIPEENKKVVSSFCKEAGLYGTDTEIVERLEAYFEKEYSYTLHPGATPLGSDYVNHFLEKTKKGLCAHFASSTVLILRQMGIPARYVEGYVIDYVNVLESAVASDGRVSDYDTDGLQGAGVVSVEVPDGNAHGWVEAYLDGRWQIVDITPPSGDEDVDTNDFWAMAGFSLFDMGSPDGGEPTGALSDKGLSLALDTGLGILGIFAGVAGIVVSFFAGRFVYRKGKRTAAWHGKDESENTVAYYAYLCNVMRLTDRDFPAADSHYKQLKIMAPSMDDEELKQYAETLERISYSLAGEKEQLSGLRDILKGILKQNKKALGWKKRFTVFWKL